MPRTLGTSGCGAGAEAINGDDASDPDPTYEYYKVIVSYNKEHVFKRLWRFAVSDTKTLLKRTKMLLNTMVRDEISLRTPSGFNLNNSDVLTSKKSELVREVLFQNLE